MSPSLSLEGKVAFVTGSTRGIGWAVARALASQGAQLVLNGVSSPQALEERTASLEAEFGGQVLGLMADASDPAQIKACYQSIFKQFKRLDILVNNAGILDGALLGMILDQQMRQVLEVNVLGSINHLQVASRLMARQKQGSIINLSSIIGLRGRAGQSVYGASKAAILGLTLSAAKELAPKGIRVNALAPGFIETDMMADLNPEQRAEILGGIGLGRFGTPEDVAGAVMFFASDLSAYITGQVLVVDGGLLI